MATYRRSITPGATYFFTLNTCGRQKVLTDIRVYHALKQSLRRVKQQLPFTIDAFVLLPDHLHCIWTLPEQDADYAKRWNIIKRYVSQQTRDIIVPPANASRLRRGELGLWQRRYWEHQIRDESDFEQHVNYIHWNPVKHGYVKRVADWPYSSFHHHVKYGNYPENWAGEGVNTNDHGKYGE